MAGLLSLLEEAAGVVGAALGNILFGLSADRVPHASDSVIIVVRSSDGIEADSDDPVYAMKLTGSGYCYRCKVDRCSNVHFVAVKTNPKNPPHCGLLLENVFHVDGNPSEFTYALVHAIPNNEPPDGRPTSTRIIVYFCNSKDAAFSELAETISSKDYRSFEKAYSPGWKSRKPCESVISHLQSEMNRPFDPDWQRRLHVDASHTVDLANYTNCALFAARIFYVLAPEEMKEGAIKDVRGVFQTLGIPESKIKKYESLLKRL